MEAKKQSSKKKYKSVGKIVASHQKQQPLIEEIHQRFKQYLSQFSLSWPQVFAILIPTLQGAFLAGAAMFWTHLLIVTWGISSLTVSAFCCGLIFAVGFSRLTLQKIAPVFAALFLFAMTSSSLFWWQGWDQFITGLLQGSETFGLITAAVLNGGLLGLIMIAVRISSQSLTQPNQEKTTGNHQAIPSTVFLGGALGLWVFTWSLNPAFPVYITATVSSSLLMLLCITQLALVRQFLSRYIPLKYRSTATSEISAVIPDSETSNTKTVNQPVSSPIFLGLITICAGWLTPAMYRVLCQLQPESTHLFYGTAAAILLGLSCSHLLNRKLNVLHLTAWLSLALLAFPLWMQAYLAISATVSVTVLAIFLRQLGIIALFLPVGMILGRILSASEKWNTARSPSTSLVFRLSALSCFLIGDAVSGMVILQTGLPVVLILGLISLAGISLFFEYYCVTDFPTVDVNSSNSKAFYKQHLKPLGLTLCCLMSFGLFSVYQPSVATKALFSAHAFNAWRNGTSIQDLSGMDDGRLLSIQETPRGTLSLWKHQGQHIQLRRNGIPAGRISTNDNLVPQPTAALLSSVLPMSIHPAPRKVLLLGMESGLALQTTLEYPVMNVVCVESDPGILQQAQSGELASTLADLLNDDRMQIKAEITALAIRRMTQKFDVIIDSPGHSAIYSNASGYDLSHYQRIEKLLAEHGLYSQRFVYSDYGPEALASLSKTMRKAFGYVTTFDTAPGEMLFIAAAQKEDVLGEGLITRISSPHVRRSLARIGWDWSVAMNLGRFDIDQIEVLKDASDCSIWQGTGSFGLSVEMMRWSNKWTQVRLALANHSQRLLNHYQEDKEVDQIVRRLSDVTACREVLRNHPDQFWVYRKTVQERLVDKPRSVVVPVKGEGLQRKIDPEDNRRLKYFKALGAVNKKESFTANDLLEVESFIEPFDPLISYYAHPELAKLYQRCDPPRPDAELNHLLHTIHFGDSRQRSVRSIHRALELLAEEECSMSVADRFDHTNTLLEVLKQRWQVRKQQQGIAQSILLIDLSKSMATSQTGLDTMQQLAQQTGVNQRTASIREKELERSLLKMLRSYRSGTLARNSRPKYSKPTIE
ncbi:MAG: hypothetical protein JKY95_03895 [Planctomycetaceae bacterium]|nr:hypothetical protein [Planctomycetaceae bacterium]